MATVQEPPCSVPVPLPTVDKTEKFCYVSIEELAAMVEKGAKKALEERDAATMRTPMK